MKHVDSNFYWNIGELPFLWGPLLSPSNGHDLPDNLPFVLEVNKDTNIISQAANSHVSAALVKAYNIGSMISGLMSDEGIGKKYADDFIDFIQDNLPITSLQKKNVLEIGCGTGYLLSRLQSMDVNVLGIEPGNHGQTDSGRYEVPVIQDFFPSNKVQQKFDMIIAYAVLEHINEPYQFILQIKKQLNDDGLLLLSVPDCEPYLRTGDISILIHEHWSYFTSQTLQYILKDFEVITIQKSHIGGSLYCLARSIVHKKVDVLNEETAISLADNFRKCAINNMERLTNRLLNFAQKKQTVGIYVPGRIINALTLTNNVFSNFRFFDDNNLMHGTYFPGIPIAVESRNNLIAQPTDNVLIMSRSFGDEIMQQLKQCLPATTMLYSWGTIFEH